MKLCIYVISQQKNQIISVYNMLRRRMVYIYKLYVIKKGDEMMEENRIKINDIKEGEVISIEREELDDYDMELIPQMIGENLLLASYVYDFEVDGFKVMNKRDITKIERGEIEKFHEFILDKEGIKKKVNVQITIDSWYTFFSSMSRKEIIDISLEREQSKENFFVGKIENVFQEAFELLKIDATGKKVNIITILYSEITLVSFQNRYSMFLKKYGETID